MIRDGANKQVGSKRDPVVTREDFASRLINRRLNATTTFASLVCILVWHIAISFLSAVSQITLALAATPQTPTAIRTAIVANAETTEFILDLTQGVTAEVFTLSQPYRVIIDVPDVTFQLPVGAGTQPAGLISNFRFGAFPEGRSRIVIATTGPVAVTQAEMVHLPPAGKDAGKSGVQLKLRLTPVTPATFGSGTGIDRELALASQVKPAKFDDEIAPQRPRSKPVVMIDPGHGGIDPGAVGSAKTLEKTVVLAVALQLKSALESTGRFDVRLTRQTDVFIPLDHRVNLSRQANADVFVSLHADTIDDRALSQAIRGTSVYTLSDKASNEGSRLMAEKENAADLAAGLVTPATGGADDVKPILYDLLARETATFSHLLSRSMVSAIGKHHALAHDPERAAAFRVLKQADAPSVLIELGFLSNAKEEQAMIQPTWQRDIAAAIASAIATYFDQKDASVQTTSRLSRFGGLPP